MVAGRFRALTLQQPFASALIFGPKRRDTRRFVPDMAAVGSWICIHAVSAHGPRARSGSAFARTSSAVPGPAKHQDDVDEAAGDCVDDERTLGSSTQHQSEFGAGSMMSSLLDSRPAPGLSQIPGMFGGSSLQLDARAGDQSRSAVFGCEPIGSAACQTGAGAAAAAAAAIGTSSASQASGDASLSRVSDLHSDNSSAGHSDVSRRRVVASGKRPRSRSVDSSGSVIAAAAEPPAAPHEQGRLQVVEHHADGLRQALKWSASQPFAQRGMATAERAEALAAAGTVLGRASKAMSFVRVVDGPEAAAGEVLKASLPLDLDEAYAIQAAGAAEVNRTGGKTVGWKAGATNEAAMKLMGVSAPFFGPIFASNVVASPTRVATGSMNLRGAELELVFEIGADLQAKPDGEYTEAEVMAATRRVYPSMELIGSRFEPAFVVNRVIERLGVFRSGQFITTGTMVGKVDVSPGDGLVAHFSGFGKMRVNLDTL
ncbi:hypothetical protein FNF28_04071 [Cafeteria roenbergensis]|uniref:Fumarylacetoacetase-like C-terminal domain-containing protein n=1 Tax=Cafeteria roenbergensis TaxID=33653 RepID=A0A5A8DGW3_CAFRO|nr:hypothetical protein FNF28_04071 [Cafeteria roenbergensis]